MRALVLALSAMVASVMLACNEPENDNAPSQAMPIMHLTAIDTPRLRPGPTVNDDSIGGPMELAATNPYEGNVHALQEGYRMYRWMNCYGCHADGGGAIGPPLWDRAWIYGSSPAQIAESIIRGRPNGMPAYGGRLSEDQVWKLVAYLQSLKPGGGLNRAGSK